MLAACEPHAGKVVIAAVNAPCSVVVSGCADGRGCNRRGAGAGRDRHRAASGLARLPFAADGAGAHAVRAALERTALASPRLTMISDNTGAVADDAIVTPAYWCRHLREPVRFREAVGSAVRVESGAVPGDRPAADPDRAGPALPGNARQADAREPASQRGRQARAARRRCGTLPGGCEARLAGRSAPPHRRLRLPTYPFQRQRYWFDAEPAYARTGSLVPEGGHPCWGSGCRCRGRPKPASRPEFRCSRPCRSSTSTASAARIVVPAASHVAMALLALAELAPGPVALEDLVFQALRLADDGERTAQLVLERRQDGGAWRLSTVRWCRADEAACRSCMPLADGGRPVGRAAGPGSRSWSGSAPSGAPVPRSTPISPPPATSSACPCSRSNRFG